MTPPIATTPDGRPTPSKPEAATAKAELQVILSPMKEIQTTVRTEINVPASQSGRLLEMLERIGQAGVIAAVAIGTLLTALAVHLDRAEATAIVLAVLAVLGVVFHHRKSRRS